MKRLLNLIDTHGGERLYGGKANEKVKHIEPTIILNPSDESPLMNEEIFGPILPIKTYKGIDDVVQYINARPKPLAVYFYGNINGKDCSVLKHRTSSGAFMTNECLMQTLSHYQGFGGVGESGYGRYGGWEGFQ